MEVGFEKGRPAPQWYEDEPYLSPGQDWFIKAFWECDSERQVGMGLGRIPRSAVRAYGSDAGLDEAMIGITWTLVQGLDSVYLQWVAAEQEKSSKRGAGGIGNKTRSR